MTLYVTDTRILAWSQLCFQLLLCILLGSFLVTALPQSQQDQPNSYDRENGSVNDRIERLGAGDVELYVNDERVLIPGLETFMQTTARFNPPLSLVYSASVTNALPGHGCFFVSTDNDPFVSNVVFSTSSMYYRTPQFDQTGLTASIPSVELVYCFRLPTPTQTNNLVAVMLDMTTETGSQQYMFKLIPIERPRRLTLARDNIAWEWGLNRAAVVYAPRPNISCYVQYGYFKRLPFSAGNPTFTRIEEQRGVVCEE